IQDRGISGVEESNHLLKKGVRSGTAGELKIEPRHLQPFALLLRGGDVLQQRLDLLAVTPKREDPLGSRSFARLSLLERLVHLAAVEHTGLPCEHIEVHLPVQELDETTLRKEGGSIAMALLAERHDPSIPDLATQELQVVEVQVGRVHAAEGGR